MKSKTKRTRIAALLLCAALCACLLSGCGASADYEVRSVKCVYNYGDRDGAELDVYTPDGTVTKYILVPYSDSGVNLFQGEIPSEDACEIERETFSQAGWESIVAAVKDSEFPKLPEELPEVEAYDGSTCYIMVETSEGTYRSGGYCAGNGSGNKHQRFYEVRSALRNAEKMKPPASAEELVGTWRGIGGEPSTLTLGKDGSYSDVADFASIIGTYTVDSSAGTLTVNESEYGMVFTYAYELSGDHLTIQLEGGLPRNFSRK